MEISEKKWVDFFNSWDYKVVVTWLGIVHRGSGRRWDGWGMRPEAHAPTLVALLYKPPPLLAISERSGCVL